MMMKVSNVLTKSFVVHMDGHFYMELFCFVNECFCLLFSTSRNARLGIEEKTLDGEMREEKKGGFIKNCIS